MAKCICVVVPVNVIRYNQRFWNEFVLANYQLSRRIHNWRNEAHKWLPDESVEFRVGYTLLSNPKAYM